MAKKLFAVVLAAAMVLGLVSTAFAAGFSDTTGAVNEKAILKLASLGLLKGYPDGTFRPNGNITRAEFAAVVVRALGYEASANLLNYAPKFSDCADATWAWGYINVATNQGIVKGYPDGTFGPNKNVTIAEAVTMLVRALGREEEAVGQWPAGHIMVASKIGMLPDNLPGVDVAATRGTVAQLVNNVLAQPIVKYNPTTAKFETVDAPNTILARNSSTLTSSKLVGDVDLTNNVVTIEGTEYDLASTVLFAGAANLTALKGQKVDFIQNEDDEIVYIGSTDTKGLSGVVSAINKLTKTITVNGVEYVVKDTAIVKLNGSDVAGDAVAKITDLKDAEVTFVVDSSSKVTYIEATKLGSEVTLDGKKTVYTSSGPQDYLVFGATEKALASNVVIKRNGAPASFTDLKVGDSIRYAEVSGKLTYVDAFCMKVSGTLQEKVVTNNHASYKISDVVYLVAVDEDGYDVPVNDPNVLPGQAVVLTLNRDGRVVKVALQTTATTAVTLQGKSERYDSTGKIVRTLTLSDGSTLTCADPYDATTNPDGLRVWRNGLEKSFSSLTSGDILKVVFDSTGKVKTVEAFATTSGYIRNATATSFEIWSVPSSDTSVTAPKAVVTYKPNYSTLVKNGIQTVITSAADLPTDAEVKITSWTVTSDEEYANVLVRSFSQTGCTVKGTFASGSDTLFVLRQNGTDKYIKLAPAAIVHRSDAAITAGDVVIGDKAKFATTGGSGTQSDPWVVTYLYVTTDTTAPNTDLNDDGAADVTVSGLTVTIQTDEDVLVSYKVYDNSGNLVNSYGATEQPKTVSVTWDGKDSNGAAAAAGSYRIVFTIKDYAGNTADPISVQVTK